MNKLYGLIAWLLFATQALAGITYHGTTGQTLYARVQTGTSTFKGVALTEGTSGGLGVYSVTDAALVSAGITSTDGDYAYTIRSGSASDTANDAIVGYGTLGWAGTVERPLRSNPTYWNGSTTPVTNFTTVFSTQFANNYDSSAKAWAANLVEIDGGSGNLTNFEGLIDGSGTYKPQVDLRLLRGTSIAATATGGILDVNVKNVGNSTVKQNGGYVQALPPNSQVVLWGTSDLASGAALKSAVEAASKSTVFVSNGTFEKTATITIPDDVIVAALPGTNPVIYHSTTDNVPFFYGGNRTGVVDLNLKTNLSNVDFLQIVNTNAADMYWRGVRLTGTNSHSGAILQNTTATAASLLMEGCYSNNPNSVLYASSTGSGANSITARNSLFDGLLYGGWSASGAASTLTAENCHAIQGASATYDLTAADSSAVVSILGGGLFPNNGQPTARVDGASTKLNLIGAECPQGSATLISQSGGVINNYSPLHSSAANRTLDVSTTGEAGLDFANIKQATAPTTLANITVPTVTTTGTATNLTNNNDKTGYGLTSGERTSIATGLADFSLSGHTTAGTAGKAWSNADAPISAISTGGTSSDFNDEPIAPALLFKLKQPTSPGPLVGDEVKVIGVGDGPTFGFDFAVDLPTNGRVASITLSIYSGTAGGVTFGTPGREGSQGKCRINGVTAGTYVIEVAAVYSTGAQRKARVTLKVGN